LGHVASTAPVAPEIVSNVPLGFDHVPFMYTLSFNDAMPRAALAVAMVRGESKMRER